MKLYKFRGLGCDRDKNRVIEILETGKFYCSKFLELNDPMEGVYSTAMDEEGIEEVFGLKSNYRICSFSGPNAFRNPLMWGYYANGFKGVAIEVEVANNVIRDIDCVKYVPAALTIEEPSRENIKDILRTKLDIWRHEDEYRFLVESEDDSCEKEIGQITAVYFGNPYGNVENRKSCQSEPSHLSYKEAKKAIIKIAKGIPCHKVKMINGRVEIENEVSDFSFLSE